MGRTVSPFSQVLSDQQQRLSKFRRALRAEDQLAFDALFEQARLHVQAAAFAADPDPAEAFFISVMIEHWKLIDSLETRLKELEKKLEAIEATDDGSAA
jgi:uncharacterized coiled-coil protein SlyX